MTIKLTCSCGCRLAVEDSAAGKKVRCPECQELLTVEGLLWPAAPSPLPANGIGRGAHAGREEGIASFGADAPSEPEEDVLVDDERLRNKRRKKGRLRQEKKQLRVVGIGLMLIYWGIICLLLGLVVRTLAVVAVLSMIRAQSGLLHWAEVLSTLLHLVTITLCLSGSVLCCWVPSGSGARGIMVISAALDGAAFALGFVSLLLALRVATADDLVTALAGVRLRIALTGISLLLRLAGFLLFFFFFRNFAEYVEDRGIAREAMDIMWSWIWLTVGGIALWVGGGFFALVVPCIGTLAFLLAFIVWFTFYVKTWLRLLNLIAAMKQALAIRWGI
jgi:hypothetical protein